MSMAAYGGPGRQHRLEDAYGSGFGDGGRGGDVLKRRRVLQLNRHLQIRAEALEYGLPQEVGVVELDAAG